MGVKELRESFNSVFGTAGSCTKALMDYKMSGGIQYQILFFAGSYADGEPFVIQSELIRPSANLLTASRETAAALLSQKRTPAT